MSGLKKILSGLELGVISLVLALSLVPTVLFSGSAFAYPSADTTPPTVGVVSVNNDEHSPYVHGNGSGFSFRANVSDNNGGSGINTSSCEYTIDGLNWLSASYNNSSTKRCEKTGITVADATLLTLNIRVKDTAGNTGTGVAITRTADSAFPVSVAVIDSAYYGHSNYYAGFIKGTASDTSGITGTVQIMITKQGHWWDGSSWAHEERSVNATGTTSWSYSGINADKFDNGIVYTVTPAVVEDGVGNHDHGTADSFTWDETTPVTTYLINPASPNGANGWYVGATAPTITLSETSGATIYWRWNSESWNSGTSPQHPVVTEGSRTLEYYSKDAANNEETPHTTKTIKYDNIAPSVNAGADKTTNALFTQNATVTGANSYSWTKQSGPGAITFGTATSEDTTVSASADGTYVIRLTATDLAGNNAYDEFTLVWDTLKPITAADAGTYIFGSWTNENNVEVTLAASDIDGSGVAATYWCYDDGSVACIPNETGLNNDGVYTEPLTFDSEGHWYLRYYSIDNAGNIEETQSQEIKIDKTAPTANISYNITLPTNTDVIATLLPSEIIIVADLTHTFTSNGSFSFSFTDRAGNPGSALATVNNIDKTVPVITLIGSATMTITQGQAFTDPGAIANDGSIVGPPTGSLNTAVAGTYVLYYNVTDAAGNHAATVTRTVVVSAPVVGLVTTVTPTPSVTPTPTPTTIVDSSQTGDETTEVEGTSDAGSNLWWVWVLVALAVGGGLWWILAKRRSDEDDK